MLPILALLFACSKESKLRPKNDGPLATTGGTCDIQSVYSPYFFPYNEAGNGFNFFKTYDWDGNIDSVAINTYGPWNLYGRVKYQGNNVYIVTHTSDTIFRAERNSLGQLIRTQHAHGDYLTPWCYYTYNSAGLLTRFQSDNSGSDDYSITYDSLGNISQIIMAYDTTNNITFTYDHTTPITGSDYLMEYYFAVMNDLEIAMRLNLLELPRHHKLIHTTSNIYPPMDIYYTNQFIDNYGKVIYYEAAGQAFTNNWHCR